MKLFTYLLIFLAIIAISFVAPAMVKSVTDFKTKDVTQEFVVNTGVGQTSVNVSLANALWYGDISLVDATSNITAENPVSSNYTDTNHRLEVSGLNASATHLLSISYKASSLTAYPSAEEGINWWPVIMVLGIIMVPVILIIGVVRRW